MPAGGGHGIQRLGAQLVGDLGELLGGQVAQVERRPDAVEQGGTEGAVAIAPDAAFDRSQLGVTLGAVV